MAEPVAEILAFLEKWKPFASLPPKDPLRADILGFLKAPGGAERHQILVRVNSLYRLQRTYGELGIVRDGESAKAATFAQLVAFAPAEFAQAVRNQQQKPFLTLLLEGFEFDRAAAAPNQLAARQFLAYFWGLRIGDPAIKYGIYPNNVVFSAGGKTHDELAREFTQQGFGSGMPLGGGFIARRGDLHFVYDTYSQFVKAGDQRQAVADSIRRSIRLTGGDDGKVKIDYVNRLE